MNRDRSDSLIRRPVAATPAARAADTFQVPATKATPPIEVEAGDPAIHRTTVVYPAAVLRSLKLAAIDSGNTVGGMVRAAIAAGLKTPARLAAEAERHQRLAGTRTTFDLDAGTHRRLKVMAAESGVTVQSLVLAAIALASPTPI